MKVVVIGGGGLMGRIAARDLVESYGAAVTLADFNVDAASKVAAWIGGNVDVRRVDINDETALDAAVRGHHCVLNAANYYHNLKVMATCLRMRVPYVDLGGLFHMTRKQLELDAQFREAALPAVIGAGADPGITNVHAAYAADRMDTIEAIRIYDGMLPAGDESIVWGYSIATILDEITMNPFAFRNGGFVELPPLSEPEQFAFAPPIGIRTVHHSLHSEVATLPVAYTARGLREVTFKINQFGFTPGVLARLKSLVDLGFASADPVTAGGGQVTPRDVLIAVLSRQAAGAAASPDGAEELVTQVHGRDAAGPVTMSLRTLATQPRWGVDPGSVMTGVPPAIATAWIVGGKLTAPGVHAPESVLAPEPFFAELAARGIRTSVAVERSVGAS